MCPPGPQNLQNFYIKSCTTSYVHISPLMIFSVTPQFDSLSHVSHHICFSHMLSSSFLPCLLSQLLSSSMYLPHHSFDPSVRQLSLVSVATHTHAHTHAHNAHTLRLPLKKCVQIRGRAACWGPTAWSCGSFSWIMLLVFLSAEGLQLQCFQHFHTCPAKKMKGRSRRWNPCVCVCVLCVSFVCFVVVNTVSFKLGYCGTFVAE